MPASLHWQAERDGGTDTTITDLLAIALVFEAALQAQFGRQIAEPWRQAIDAHAAPVAAQRRPDHRRAAAGGL